jgi:hypothetical protein
MSASTPNPSDDRNTGNDGFVWSSRTTLVAGVVLAVALAAARIAPILAAPFGWGG